MASLVLGIAGAAALGPSGLAFSGFLGMSGAQIGFIAGSSLGSMLFAPNMPDIQGPRLSDLKVQASTYGTMIPIYYGTARGAGQVIWSSDLIETSHEEEAGGKGGPSQSVTTYTYSVNCAVGICEGEITGVRRIWANGDLIYDQSAGNMGPTGQSSNIRVYTGSETQVADSLLESYLGAGNVPAHRGLAYVVFENLQLEKFGNRIPNFSFEVVADGTFSTPSPTKQTTSTTVWQMPHPFIDGIFLSVSADNGSSNPYVLHITDVIANTDRTVDVGTFAASNGSGRMTYVKYVVPDEFGVEFILINEIWVNINSSPYVAVAFDATTLTFSRLIEPINAIGLGSVGNMYYDSSTKKVIFASANFSGTKGYNALNPLTLEFDGVKTADVTNNVWSGVGAVGENSIALSNYNNYISFFSGAVSIKNVAVTPSEPWIAYDSFRNRYAIWDRNASGKSVFKTFDDNGIYTETEYTPDTIAMTVFGSFEYLKYQDLYVISDTKYLYYLDPNTFETITSRQIFTVSGGDVYAMMEINRMPEYIVGFVNEPSGGLALIPVTDRLAANTVTLSSIVTDICNRVDLAAGDIDVTQLTDEVEGYTIAQQMSARAALDGVQAAFFFDAVESN